MIYFHDIDPIALSLGPIKVHWYGIMYLLGFTAAWLLGRKRIANSTRPKAISGRLRIWPRVSQSKAT